MSPELTLLVRASRDAARNVNNMSQDHPLYHEAKLLAVTANASMIEALFIRKTERGPVDTHIVEEYRAALAHNQRLRDTYRRQHFFGRSHCWSTVTLTASY